MDVPLPEGYEPVDNPLQGVTPYPAAVQQRLSEQNPTITDVTRAFLSQTSVGRVMKAIGVGATEPFGAPLGMSPETVDAARQAGFFRKDPTKFNPLTDSVQAFNEAMLIPAAKDLDAAFRVAASPFTAIAHGIGQIAEESGLATGLGYYDYGQGHEGSQGNAVANDILGAMDTASIVIGAHGELPLATATAKQSTIATMEGLKRDQIPVRIKEFLKSEYGGSGEPPEKPPLPMPDDAVPKPGATPEMEGAKSPPPPIHTEPLAPEPPPFPSRAGNINLDRINAPDDVKQVIVDTAAANKDFEAARRGKMTFEDISNLANAMGMTPAQLAKRKVGQAFNAEEALAARNLLVASAQKVRDLAREAVGGTDEQKIAVQQAIVRHAAIQEQVAGMTAEAGRALAQFNIKSEATERAKQLADMIQASGGRDNIEATIEAINNLDSADKVSRFVRDTWKPTLMDKIVEAWINGLLSNPVTHVKNTVGNTLVAAHSITETGLASAIGGVRVALGIGSDERVLPGEAGARAFAFLQGSKDGVIAARQAFTEEAAVGKVDQKKRAIGGLTGQVIRTPTRFLGAEDAFFKAIGHRQEIAALAYRQATKEGLEGADFRSRIAQLISDPTPEMLDKAEKTAAYQTFTQPLGETGKALQKALNGHPVIKFVVPFFATPVNMIKYAGERTALAPLSKEWRATLAGKNGDIERDTLISRMALGTALTASAFAMAANGQVTGGGPTDPNARALLYLTGWQPYSVRIGDTYYSYQWADPFATTLGVAADAYEIQHQLSAPDAGDIGGLILGSVTKNILNKTWLQGPADLLQATEDPERYGKSWALKWAGSFVPAGVAQFARTKDPYIRDARTLIDTYKSRLPGLSTEVLPKRDIWGNELRREGALGPDIASPIYLSSLKDDFISREMLRLGVWKAPVPRKIRGVDLTPEQYDEYAATAGKLARFGLEQFVGKGNWTQIPPGIQAELIDKAFDRMRESARTYMLTKDDILQKTIDARIEDLTGDAPSDVPLPPGFDVTRKARDKGVVIPAPPNIPALPQGFEAVQ